MKYPGNDDVQFTSFSFILPKSLRTLGLFIAGHTFKICVHTVSGRLFDKCSCYIVQWITTTKQSIGIDPQMSQLDVTLGTKSHVLYILKLLTVHPG